jgi:hypothetical protein
MVLRIFFLQKIIDRVVRIQTLKPVIVDFFFIRQTVQHKGPQEWFPAGILNVPMN